MEVNSIADVITAVAAASLPIIVAYVSRWLKGNKQAETLVSVLPTLAKDAVIAMQKLGVSEAIEGVVKKAHAVQIVAKALSDLGFNETNEATLANAVESAYAQLKADGTLDAYPQAAKPDDTQAEIAKAEAELASIKEQEVAAQKQLDALKGAQN
ncbi:P163 [Limosilactobacillus fermentum]|uniref:phage holin, LLH family n=1 Tax=Limosilactobacillus fermentum TaxID=1613 RepID=UPI0005E7BD41|nr:phage holin, LLH family [Limosilactobacillus fermentum]CDN26036.1 P163 [Limosilactobacillus fermentum]